jgi:hypothetical protein
MGGLYSISLTRVLFVILACAIGPTPQSQAATDVPLAACEQISTCNLSKVADANLDSKTIRIEPTLKLEERYPARADNIRMSRELGLSDQTIQQQLESAWDDIRKMGFSDPQINEMYQGERPFPPMISPILMHYPALLNRTLNELKELMEAPVPYKPLKAQPPISKEEEKERQQLLLELATRPPLLEDRRRLKDVERERDALRKERDQLKGERDRLSEQLEQSERDAGYWFFNGPRSRQR